MAVLREDLGRRDYLEVWELQKQRVQQRIEGEIPDTALFVEHPSVYTVGRRRGAEQNLLAVGDTPVVHIERGGDVTWHGPGQLVVYPIVKLPGEKPDIHRYLRELEEAIIQVCQQLQLPAERDPRNTGVWIRGRKVASIGVACRRWVTWHGLALNISPDMRAFQRIQPCGMAASVMTSLEQELAGDVPPWDVLADQLEEALQALTLSSGLG